MRTLRYVLIDVFTDRPLAGNALAVFTDARGVDAAQMQAIAREMNLSETTFVLPAEAGGHARVRIFTPTRELPFAGHPVLGTAFVLGQPMQVEAVRLETGVGTLRITLEREGPRVTFGWMQQPVPTIEPWGEREAGELCAALGLEASTLPVTLYDNGMRHVYVAASDVSAVARLRPDLARLPSLPSRGFNAFATTRTGGRVHVRTRMFAPGDGVPEDPATGSAAGPLAVHLVRHGLLPLGDTVEIEQGLEVGRPSRLWARVHGHADVIEAVEVGGSAVVVGRGELRLP